jgi:adenylate cyclase
VTLLRRIGWSRLAGIALVLALLAIRIADPVFVERLRLQAFDGFQQLHPRAPAPFPVAILDVDDRSLAEIGQWPWPRTRIAEMTLKAMQAGAVAVAFDILFSEEDRLSPEKIALDNVALPPAVRAELSALPPNDAVLADAFARSRVVVGQTSVRQQAVGQDGARPPDAIPHAVMGPDPRPFMIRLPELVQNLPILEDAAAGHGVFTVLPDPDGVYRRVPVVLQVQETYRLGLSIELLRIATGGEAFAIRSNEAGIDGVVVARQLIRTERDGTVWNNFSRSDPARFVPATDLLNDRLAPGRLAGHLVLVGTSAIGLEDFRATPLGVPMAGVEIHAQVLENIMGQSLLTRPNYAIAIELVWIAVLSLLVVALAPLTPARYLVMATVSLVLSYFMFSYYMFIEYRQLIDPIFPIVALVLTTMLMSTSNYIREEMRKQQIRGAFGQYVSPDLVAELADNPERLKLGGERRELSILFTDVRGFTAISESFADDPAGLTQLMNRFLTVMSDAIMAERGTIDKYMGDAIMAFWNAPTDVADHPARACAAALTMLDEVAALNRALAAEAAASPGTPVRHIDIGIGINTGTCVVGNMGSDKRFDYSALGDAVNLASRLEGQTKAYGVDIIVGAQTAEAIADRFALIELDLIRVKGKQVPERIFAVLGGADLRGQAEMTALAETNDTMIGAYRSRDWDAARAACTALRTRAAALDLDLGDYTAMYDARIDAYAADDPGPDWEGVFEATSK